MFALNRCFIFVFMAMLTLPLIFVDLSSDRVSVKENRMLADHPKLTDLKHHQGQFIRDFDAWFKDSTGFREQMLALFNIIGKNTWLNNNFRYTEGLYVFLIGEQGHHYFADVGGRLISVFQGKPVLSDERLTSMAVKLEEVKTYLDKQGIPFIVMFCTMKESIYPEFYPKAIIRGHEPIQLDVITSYLKDHTSVDVFNIRQALLAEKDKYLLYPINGDIETLAHYNDTGAFFAYRELMKHINVHFPGIIPFELKDIDITYNEKGETDWSIKTNISYKELDPSFFNNISFSDIDFFNTHFNYAYENTVPDLPTILYLRTSFSYPLGILTAQHFGNTIMTHFVNMGHLEEYVNKWKPDIVVFETVERQLDMFADAVIGIPDLATKRGGY